MLDLFFILIAIGLGSANSGSGDTAAGPGALETVESGASPQSYAAEPQVPSGKFTTATEIKPIMNATRANWVAVREFDGNDLIYMTHILSWRCGMVGLRYAINDGPMQDWPLGGCDEDTAQPNAIPQDATIYEVHPLGSIAAVEVEIIYDDLSRDTARFDRKSVLVP